MTSLFYGGQNIQATGHQQPQNSSNQQTMQNQSFQTQNNNNQQTIQNKSFQTQNNISNQQINQQPNSENNALFLQIRDNPQLQQQIVNQYMQNPQLFMTDPQFNRIIYNPQSQQQLLQSFSSQPQLQQQFAQAIQSNLATQAPQQTAQFYNAQNQQIAATQQQPQAGQYSNQFQSQVTNQNPLYSNLFNQNNAPTNTNAPINTNAPTNTDYQLQQQQNTLNLNQTKNDNREQEHEKSLFAKCCACFTLQFYQPYFDVTTEIVAERIKFSFMPWRDNFFQIEHNHQPDLYGPFWICTTLMFTLTASGNLSSYFQHPDIAYFSYNFDFVPMAASIVYTFGFLLPILMCSVMKCFGCDKMTYLKTICIYGYSVTCYIPVSIMCSYPNQGAQWAFMGYAMINTTFFLVQNLSQELNFQKFGENRFFIVMIIAVFQLAALLVYKLYFFQQIFAITTYGSQQANTYQTQAPALASTHAQTIIHDHYIRHHNQ